eukprot:TRINITY_DN17368_c0_g1_i2.p1 TRINITY_DN17368_c0_g1~~TRINITY_DN17368_c0_g1_i2.p1  ORF type:complete len:287 (+),score=118.73 TRINITY_DN17368_c0_g1_i2:72-863(+)
MPTFRARGNDEALQACVEARRDRLKELLTAVPRIVAEWDRAALRAQELLAAWVAPRAGRLSQGGSGAEMGDDVDLEALLARGLEWDEMKPVVKTQRPRPAPKDPSEVPAAPPPPGLVEELRGVMRDGEVVESSTSNILALIELMEPCPVEGQAPPEKLLNTKLLVTSIWAAMVPVKKLTVDYYSRRAQYEVEYYKECLTCDWLDAMESIDHTFFLKAVRYRKLFGQLLLYVADLITKNAALLDKFADPELRNLIERRRDMMIA